MLFGSAPVLPPQITVSGLAFVGYRVLLEGLAD